MKHLPIFLIALTCSSAAFAQSAPVVDGNAYTAPPTLMGDAPAGEEGFAPNPARQELRISNMEDELRILRGKNEELEFQIRKLTENAEKLQRDLEMRLTDLESGKKMQHADNMPAAKPAPKIAEEPATAQETTPATAQPSSGGDGQLRAPSAADAPTPRDLYNAAFRLLNQTKYEEAAAAFDRFTKQYPKDPLIGNAYYWQGETFYIRRDYVTAADNFRAGFEALPTGPKAADNLLKLAMSLDALKRDKEACVVLGQIVSKFKKDSVSVTEKAVSEQKRMGCK